jgi:pyruvate formate lyase activating enzyme
LAQDAQAFIFDIQGFSVHDGPGCRTVVFLSGCPLHCQWCSNPEGQDQQSRLLHRRHLCRACGRCVAACPAGAIRIENKGGQPAIARSACASCETFACISRCWSGALTRCGRMMAADELFTLLNRDRNFWGAGGGVTFSGGEPFMQHRFLNCLLRRCQGAYIHTAIETCGHVAPAILQESLPFIDWLFFDIKHLDSASHRRATGVGNALILANLKSIVAAAWPGRLLVRMTVIPGFNDDPDHVRRLGEHLRGLGISEMQLLPLHRLGFSKYAQLGLPVQMPDATVPSSAAMTKQRVLLQQTGLTVYLEDDAPF